MTAVHFCSFDGTLFDKGYIIIQGCHTMMSETARRAIANLKIIARPDGYFIRPAQFVAMLQDLALIWPKEKGGMIPARVALSK
jgi:hypothetical protein